MTTLTLLAICLMLECGGEPIAGKRGVASVIWARADGKAANVERVLLKRKQFSCLNRGLKYATAKAERMKATPSGAAAWLECVLLAEKMLSGQFQPTITANHYYNPSLCSPSWGKALRGKVKIGNHIFGSL